ncbi:hypothetical protein HZA55_03765 [Candidatus Poribacteria bacterium]|nr:hypothetical protein [Candidatus Poribacteria bacterium]
MKKYLLIGTLLIFLVGLYSESYAKDLGFNTSLGFTQDNVKTFAKELGGAIAYRQYQAAKPLGLTGFDLGLQVNISPIKNKDVWNKVYSYAGTKDAPAVLPIPMIFVKKGLPFNIDLGVRGLPVPGTNLTIMGGNLKYSILEGTIATPAVGITVDYSQVKGSKDFDLNVLTANASISKGFGPLTPYGGIAMDQTDLKITNSTLKQLTTNPLSNAKASGTRLFAGLRFALLPILAITGEVNMGEVTSYGLTAAVGF